ncbi:MAG TPA: addiction module protein [Gemmata sp.]|jgi:putative addiction module component (TIGR02574 family)|nr:addiction module protein [Gemmata sp.]
MSVTLESLGITQMSIDDRIALVEEILDTISADQEKLPLTDAQKAELDRRMAAYKANPTAVIPWEQIKAESLARFPE